jgi:hypothetical protein
MKYSKRDEKQERQKERRKYKINKERKDNVQEIFSCYFMKKNLSQSSQRAPWGYRKIRFCSLSSLQLHHRAG